MSDLLTNVPSMVKIDVEAVSRMLDEMLALPSEVIRRSEFEETEPDYEFLVAVSAPGRAG